MMTESEIFVSKQIRTLVPNYDSVELKATVSSSSFSVEFFITISGKKMQCFEMIDKGMFTEKNFNIISKAIANHFRGLPNFNTDSINKYTITLKQQLNHTLISTKNPARFPPKPHRIFSHLPYSISFPLPIPPQRLLYIV